MENRYILPAIMISLNLGQAIVLAFCHDWRGVIYWVSASVLTASVSFRG